MNRKLHFLLILLFFYNCILFCQSGNVGIGTTTPHSSALLDLVSTDKGILIPRIASTQSIVLPAVGLLVYDNSSNSFKYYNGTIWQELITSESDPKIGANTRNYIPKWGGVALV